MTPTPIPDLRSNLATWAVPAELGPAAARVLLASYPREAFDPGFQGQELATTYFDTAAFVLRRARRRGDRYLTLRVRCYRTPGGAEAYAASAKTEGAKWRREIDPATADALLAGEVRPALERLLPADLLARLYDLAGDAPLGPAVTVRCRRFAVEDDQDRLTLDMGVRTDTGKWLAANVLEFKSTRPDAPPPEGLAPLGLRPIKLSKFLWATLWR